MSTEPIVVEQTATTSGAELLLSIPPDIECVRGHFAAAPIVPGVVQLEWAIESARRLLAVVGAVVRMEALKFHHAMVPGMAVTLTLKWSAAERKLDFTYRSETARFSSGRLSFRSEP